MARHWRAAAIALLAAAPAAHAQPASPPAIATIDDAAWLAGRWVGTGLGGEVEETWSPPAGGQMIGHFALRRAGRPVFYELMMIDVGDGGVRLRVKHFNPDFTAWEDRGGWHTFLPVSARPGDLRLRGLHLRRDGNDLLITIALRDGDGDGPAREHELRLRRAPL